MNIPTGSVRNTEEHERDEQVERYYKPLWSRLA